MMTIEQLFTQIDIARQHSDEAADLVLRRFIRGRSHLPRPRPEMPTSNFGPRKELTELRPRHLLMVEEYGVAETYNRHELGQYFLTNWNRLFGTLRRSKAMEVPSDQLRKEMMVSRLLDLIEMRRSEYADERSEDQSNPVSGRMYAAA
jgi:hypothetical protein